jgi:hypothetical protein
MAFLRSTSYWPRRVCGNAPARRWLTILYCGLGRTERDGWGCCLSEFLVSRGDSCVYLDSVGASEVCDGGSETRQREYAMKVLSTAKGLFGVSAFASVSIFVVTAGFVLASGPALAQDTATPPAQAGQQSGSGAGSGQGQRGGRGGWGGGLGAGRGLVGTVTEVAADHYIIKTDAGESYTVHFSANTRIMKQPAGGGGARGEGGGSGRGEGGGGGYGGNPPQTLKPTDIKVGDAVMAAGDVDAQAKSVGAMMIMQIDPERAKQMREMQANYGKTWLMGKVTAIDGVKVTLTGSVDNAPHTFVADENTTFRKRRDPITLADIQVGDNVRVDGAVKDGNFLATAVNAMGAPPQGQTPTVPRNPPPPQ